ncbi:Hypothetical protein A7982_09304 [Minicystis rosea]|nr:Hypothetical protein A7982_09304 [Minicystis rosea]
MMGRRVPALISMAMGRSLRGRLRSVDYHSQVDAWFAID